MKGFEDIDNAGTLPNILQEVELKYVSQAACITEFGADKILPSMMCAKNPGQGASHGDDGGPLFDANRNVLVGIVSLGDVFSRIANQWTWIQTTICANHSNPKPDFCAQAKTTQKPVLTSSSSRSNNNVGLSMSLFVCLSFILVPI